MAEEPNNSQATNSQEAPMQPKWSPPVPVLAGGIFGLLVLAGVIWIASRPPAPPPPPPSEESLAYLSNVTLSSFRMSVADNMIGSVILYLDGTVTNGGDRNVRQLRVRLYFYDSLSQVILRPERDIIGSQEAPLAAGESRDFQLRLERPPASWNIQPPQMQLVSLEIE